jgi:NAD(P)-dependent dehydrogenase (short-subunit alcohol dehydrogenase family)
MADLTDRVVTITGAGRGIGAGLAERIIASGGRVVGVSRSAPGLNAPRGASYVHLQGDVAADPPERLLGAVLDLHGRVDGLVNNAAVQHYAESWELSDTQFDEMLAVNLTAPFLLSQAFARHWRAQGQPGVVVNICSVESEVGWPSPPQAGYAATKGGLLGLTRAMALDLAGAGIRVLAVGPGAIDTGMAPADLSYAARIPLGNAPGTPQDVGEVVAFLLSDAARYMTGTIVYVDGGYLVP